MSFGTPSTIKELREYCDKNGYTSSSTLYYFEVVKVCDIISGDFGSGR